MSHSSPGSVQLPGPCWELPEMPCDPCLDPESAADEAEFAEAFRAAASFVWGQTCQRWPGDCWEEVTRPCLPSCGCSCPTSCEGCGIWREFDLTDAFLLPIVEIVRVEVAGCGGSPDEVWTPESGEFRLEMEGTLPRLVRQIGVGEDRLGSWPHQLLERRAGQPCTWQVVARTGVAPPVDVVAATASFALDLVKECRATGCSVLRGARSVAYRNISIERDSGDGEIGEPGLWTEVLRKTFDRFGDCGKGSHTAYGWVPSADAPRFHRVSGPIAAV